MLFIKYVSDKYGDSDDFAPPVTIPKGASFKEMVALKGDSDIGNKINMQVIQPLIDANSQIACAVPTKIAFELVAGVKDASFYQALGKTERHGSVVHPIARNQVKSTAANNFREMLKGPGCEQQSLLCPVAVSSG